MDRVRVFQVDAFTDEPLAGNAAGVVPDAEGLSTAQMQSIARELAVSETIFFTPSDRGDRRARYFTPSTEIELCGHATVAGVSLLDETGELTRETHRIETDVGILDVDVENDGSVWMTQDEPEIRELSLEYDRIADALGIDTAALRGVGADLPLARADTGIPYLVVPVNFLQHLGDVDPDIDAIERLSEDVDVVGVYAFTFDALDAESTLHGRMFGPRVGIAEDPVTGTASGAVGAYLRRFGAFETIPDEMAFEQGHFLDRPGIVRVRATDEIRVGGRAVTTLEGTLTVPENDEDEILEI